MHTLIHTYNTAFVYNTFTCCMSYIYYIYVFKHSDIDTFNNNYNSPTTDPIDGDTELSDLITIVDFLLDKFPLVKPLAKI